jgi:ATP-binding cassette subfamily C (CFTR/MRP) protein 1
MKSIKLCGLANSMKDLLQEERLRELNLGRRFRRVTVCVSVIANAPSIVSTLVVFATYAIQAKVDHTAPLTTAKAFASLSLLKLITSPGAALLQSIPQITAGMGCVRRVNTFLLSDSFDDGRKLFRGNNFDDKNQTADYEDSGRHPGAGKNIGVSVSGLVLGSEKEDVVSKFQGISFQAGSGSLITVIGPVGSGKSTLLRAMLGEVKPTRGTITISSPFVGYCSQAPWLPNVQIREAIIGANKFEEEWYQKIVHICALGEDFESMPQNDLTILGSRGVVLSGGQKHRVVSEVNHPDCVDTKTCTRRVSLEHSTHDPPFWCWTISLVALIPKPSALSCDGCLQRVATSSSMD